MAGKTSSEQVSNVTLTVMVDKERNKVLFAEARKDFVDVLLSFLTLPLGTIVRHVSTESNTEAVRLGSISSLYQGVVDEQGHLWSQTCKEILLKPRNSTGAYCQKMKVNIDDTKPLQSYFVCGRYPNCKHQSGYKNLSFFSNQECLCGLPFHRERHQILHEEDGFVYETSTFIISDDLCVMPSLFGTSLNILQKHGINGFDAFDKQTLNLCRKEVLDLLKLSLVSKTPLSDFLFKKKQLLYSSSSITPLEVCTGEEREHSNKIVVKVVRRKSNKQLLFVEGEDDFANIVLSFLTFPIGAVLHMLHGTSLLSCIDNLYKSMTELSSDKYFRSQDIKDLLTHPFVFVQYELRNQILPIRSSYYNFEKIYRFQIKVNETNTLKGNWVDPKSPITGGYVRGPMTYMVKDNLVVTPMTSMDGISYIERMKVPLNDVEEVEVKIGQKECLSILKASLTSTQALSNGLYQYIGSGAVQADLSSNAASTDRPLKKPKKENEA